MPALQLICVSQSLSKSCRQLQVLRGHRRHQLSIYLVAVSGVFPETRTKVSFDPCVWHRAKGWVSHTGELPDVAYLPFSKFCSCQPCPIAATLSKQSCADLANLKFSPRQSSWGIKCYKPLKDLDSPDYLNSNRELKVLARISMPYQVCMVQSLSAAMTNARSCTWPCHPPVHGAL